MASAAATLDTGATLFTANAADMVKLRRELIAIRASIVDSEANINAKVAEFNDLLTSIGVDVQWSGDQLQIRGLDGEWISGPHLTGPRGEGGPPGQQGDPGIGMQGPIGVPGPPDGMTIATLADATLTDTATADTYLSSPLPNNSRFEISAMLQWWQNAPTGGGFAVELVVPNSLTQIKWSVSGNTQALSSGDIINFTGESGERLIRLVGLIQTGADLSSITVVRGHATTGTGQNSVLRANSHLFIRKLP
jgi:hypothetical protein